LLYCDSVTFEPVIFSEVMNPQQVESMPLIRFNKRAEVDPVLKRRPRILQHKISTKVWWGRRCYYGNHTRHLKHEKTLLECCSWVSVHQQSPDSMKYPPLFDGQINSSSTKKPRDITCNFSEIVGGCYKRWLDTFPNFRCNKLKL